MLEGLKTQKDPQDMLPISNLSDDILIFILSFIITFDNYIDRILDEYNTFNPIFNKFDNIWSPNPLNKTYPYNYNYNLHNNLNAIDYLYDNENKDNLRPIDRIYVKSFPCNNTDQIREFALPGGIAGDISFNLQFLITNFNNFNDEDIFNLSIIFGLYRNPDGTWSYNSKLYETKNKIKFKNCLLDGSTLIVTTPLFRMPIPIISMQYNNTVLFIDVGPNKICDIIMQIDYIHLPNYDRSKFVVQPKIFWGLYINEGGTISDFDLDLEDDDLFYKKYDEIIGFIKYPLIFLKK